MTGESRLSLLVSDWRGKGPVLRVSENVASIGRPWSKRTSTNRTTPVSFRKWHSRSDPSGPPLRWPGSAERGRKHRFPRAIIRRVLCLHVCDSTIVLGYSQ
jgi:hypothetical protein